MRRVLLIVLAAVWLAPTAAAWADQADQRLGTLFDRLKETSSGLEAQLIERSIWKIWLESGDQALDAEVNVGVEAMVRGDAAAAFKVFDSVVAKAPAYAEGWNKRATLYYYLGNYPASIADVERTLALEPRHFGALSGLGMIHLETGNEREALAAMEKALAIHPHLMGVRAKAQELKEKFRGRPI